MFHRSSLGAGRALAVSVLLLLVGCDNYPRDWAALERPLFAPCPDLSGTYRIGEIDDEGLGRDAGMHDSLFRHILPPRTAQRWHWETMTIAGDAASALEVTLMRSPRALDRFRLLEFKKGGKDYYKKQYLSMHSPATRWSGGFATMTDAAYEENLSRLYLRPIARHVLKRGQDYECGDGWIVNDRLAHDPGPDRDHPRPDSIAGVVRFTRDKAGYLVAESRYRQRRELTLWCGDGCKGIPLGTWTEHLWRHWAPDQPAWQGERPRPWAEPFRLEAPLPSSEDSRSERIQEVSAMVTPMLVSPATLVDALPAGGDAIIRLDSPATDAFSATIKALKRSYAFTRVEVRELERTAGSGWRMRLVLGLKPRPFAATPLEAIERRVRALLPAGVRLTAVKASGSGFRIIVHCKTDREVSQLLRNIDTSRDFARPELESMAEGPDRLREVRVHFVEP